MKILSPTKVELQGRVLTSFGGTNYLGLSFHPRILDALSLTARRSGLGMGASRKTTGTTDEVLELERRAAALARRESAIVTTSGTLANIGLLDGLRGYIDHWLVDEGAHTSFARCLPISGAPYATYRHADPEDLRVKRSALTGHVGLYTDALFPMTGEVPPLAALAEAAGDAILVFDEAHSLGTMGPGGRGLAASLALPGDRTIVTGTLSKAFGCMGGLILGPTGLVERIRESSAILAATGALSPALSAAGSTALDVLEQEPQRFGRLRSNIALMRGELGLCSEPEPSPIFWQSESAARGSAAALDAGYLVPLVSSYPGAPYGAMLRWIVSSEHAPEDICTVARILTRL